MGIFVAGMHRSGTSMVASILHALGANLGPSEDMVPANQFNPAGYFENASIVALNEAFAGKNNLTWRTLPALQLRKSVSGVTEYGAAARDIAAKLSEKKPWAIKDPRLSFLLEHWKGIASPISVIICLRRPGAVALSLRTRNELSLSYGGALWQLYTLAALRNSRRLPRALVVYEELLSKPRKTIEKLIAEIPELAALKPGEIEMKAALACVRPELDHSEAISAKVMPPGTNELYARLARGDLSVPKGDSADLALELVRLEAGHQSAKRLHIEARDQLAITTKSLQTEKAILAKLTERLADIVAFLEPQDPSSFPQDPETLVQRLRQATRHFPSPAQQKLIERGAEELVRHKDERIAWLQNELIRESARAKGESEAAVNLIVGERDSLIERVRELRDRLSKSTTQLAQLNAMRIEDAERLRDLRTLTIDRDLLSGELARTVALLEQRNTTLFEFSEREHNFSAQSHKLEAEIEQLRGDLLQQRLKESELKAALAARDQNEQALRMALSQLSAADFEHQHQLSAANITIGALERSLAYKADEASIVEALLTNEKRVRLDLEMRLPALENAAIEGKETASRQAREANGQIAELSAQLAVAIAERERTAEDQHAALVQVTDLLRRIGELSDQLAVAEADLEQAKQQVELASQKASLAESLHATNVADVEADSRLEIDKARSDHESTRTDDAVKAKAAAAKIENERDALAQSLEAARQEIDALTKELQGNSAAAHALEATRKEIDALKKELQSKSAAVQALEAARNQIGALKKELQSKSITSPPRGVSGYPDQRLRRQLLVLNELLDAIDRLLSPRFGRFTIPVRRIRVKLVQARSVLDGEIAKTKT